MDNLIKCSRILYDVDIYNKQQEIVSLKKRINELEQNIEEYTTPKVFCKNHVEWHRKITYVLEYIYNNITNIQLIDDDEEDIELFTGPGRWAISDKQIKSELFVDILTWLTGKEKWSHNIVIQIMADLKCILDILKIHEKYNESERRDFIYYFIHDKLCERHTYSILAGIPQYTCGKCGKIYNDPYDSEDSGEIFEISEECDSCFGSS